ncbi:uncharacterized protein JCM10292_004452 [Rhodotorula paludigena]|uniref:uncharacterized protein n=1 Tax=Rhodotorula paludigena TaxID=86838 RepID=UPI00316EEADF
MSPRWVEPFYRNPHLVSLSLTAVSDVPFDLSDPFWRQLERLDVQVESPFHGQHGSSIAAFLQNFPFPAGQVRLRRLSVTTQLQTRFVSSPRALQDIVTALISTFSHAPLESLAFDDHASCESEDLARLAAGFPALRSLSLGDRMVWNGSRRDLLSSLAPLTSLETLSCRLLPVVPPSLFDSLPSPKADESVCEGDDLEQFASPASIALEAATVLPALALVGFSGQSSAVEWFRVRRDAESQPCEVEAVTLVDLDLDRP